MPVHQINGLACQCTLDVGHEFIEVQDMLGAGFTEYNVSFFACFQVIQEPLTGELYQFPGDNLTRYDPFGVANAIRYFCHTSLSFVKIQPADPLCLPRPC
ncbi:hypothetical protein Xedl_03880 [Xenorhabdus eapokensis]|uniref:Uncharacterized protein n=1 Tax=Xenorhabdus eapokensis TaxID=1873482 RepID=A0A1Q5TD23_9GAMM|nr:hypothetical protein Xedl_03880 [Xenorhabdus eapokensis]